MTTTLLNHVAATALLALMGCAQVQAQTKLVVSTNKDLSGAKEYTMVADRKRIMNGSGGQISTTLYSLGLKKDQLPGTSDDDVLYWQIKYTPTQRELPDSTNYTSGQYVIFDNTVGWAAPHIWAWDANSSSASCCTAGYPGDAMTKSGDFWIWAVPSGKNTPTSIQINDGASSSTTAKTADLKYYKGAIYNGSGSIVSRESYDVSKNVTIYSYGGSGTTTEADVYPAAPTDGCSYVYFKNTNNWSGVKIYAWSGSGSSVTEHTGSYNNAASMTLESGCNVYYYKFNSGVTPEKVIFYNASNSSDKAGGDLTFTNGQCYDGEGKAYTFKEATGGEAYALGTASASWSSSNITKGCTDPSNCGEKNIFNYESKDVTGATTNANVFQLKRGEGLSYTFSLSTTGEYNSSISDWSSRNKFKYSNTSGQASVQLYINKHSFRTDGKGYYLIGNITNATGGSSWDPSGKDRREMKKLIYYNPTQTEVVDSIVYEATVSKPSAGFSELYLGFISIDQKESGTWNDGDWCNVIRPESHDEYDSPALSGALFRTGDITGDYKYNPDQTINPQLSDAQKAKYTSYTVRFNATYKTYNIIFNEGLYIIGPAVYQNGASLNWKAEDAIKMEYHQTGQYYSAKVNLKAGQKFVFIKDKSYYQTIAENDSVPDGLDEAPWVNRGDTHYYNVVKSDAYSTLSGKTGEETDFETTLSSIVKPINFVTPEQTSAEDAKEYEVRFYESYPGESENTDPFYTLNRVVKLVRNNKAESGTPNVLRAMATTIPLYYEDNDLKLYVASSVSKGTTGTKTDQQLSVTLTDVTSQFQITSGENTYKYIPANVPVLLVKTVSDAASTSNTTETIDLACRPFINATAAAATLSAETSNLLQSINTRSERQVWFTYGETEKADKEWKTGDKVTARGYLFTLLPTTTEKSTYVPCFLRTKSGKSATERAYLKLDASDSDSDSKFNPEDLTSYAYNTASVKTFGTASQAKAALQLVWDNDNETDARTGITTVADTETAQDNAWYNLAGQQLSAPQKGLNIQHGRKVLVR